MVWTPILLILGLVAVVVVVALLLGREPGEQEGQAGMSALDRFLAEARGDRQPGEGGSTQAIPTARPRQRPRTAPPRKPVEPQRSDSAPVVPPPVEPPSPVFHRPEPAPVIIHNASEYSVVPSSPPPTIDIPATLPRAKSSVAAKKLFGLMQDRENLQAAFLLNELLKPPRSARRR